jgi:peptidoglycan/xylan/chitin deacetylase (PgdA/CDA1 family)
MTRIGGLGRAAWLCVIALIALAAPAAAQQRRIALSFDDVPRAAGAFMTPQERTTRLIAGLKQAGVDQAAFFVTPGRLDAADGRDGAKHVAAYAAAGHVIANHSFGHRRLTGVEVDAYLSDIDRAEAWLKNRPGYRGWFRFPFLDEGGKDKVKRDAVRAGLGARGLTNAYVTVDGSDWNLETLTVQAVAAGKTIDMPALKQLYVETMVEAANFYDDVARRALGRSPAHVILLHETDLAALYVVDLVDALRQHGWTIISADDAYADAIAAIEPDVPSAQGPRSELIAWERGIPPPRWYDRNTIHIADRLFAERVLHETEVQP